VIGCKRVFGRVCVLAA